MIAESGQERVTPAGSLAYDEPEEERVTKSSYMTLATVASTPAYDEGKVSKSRSSACNAVGRLCLCGHPRRLQIGALMFLLTTMVISLCRYMTFYGLEAPAESEPATQPEQCKKIEAPPASSGSSTAGLIPVKSMERYKDFISSKEVDLDVLTFFLEDTLRIMEQGRMKRHLKDPASKHFKYPFERLMQVIEVCAMCLKRGEELGKRLELPPCLVTLGQDWIKCHPDENPRAVLEPRMHGISGSSHVKAQLRKFYDKLNRLVIAAHETDAARLSKKCRQIESEVNACIIRRL